MTTETEDVTFEYFDEDVVYLHSFNSYYEYTTQSGRIL